MARSMSWMVFSSTGPALRLNSTARIAVGRACVILIESWVCQVGPFVERAISAAYSFPVRSMEWVGSTS